MGCDVNVTNRRRAGSATLFAHFSPDARGVLRVSNSVSALVPSASESAAVGSAHAGPSVAATVGSARSSYRWLPLGLVDTAASSVTTTRSYCAFNERQPPIDQFPLLANSLGLLRPPSALMAPFEPEGVYCNIPYRVLPDSSIEAMMPGGLVKFKNMDQFLAASGSATATNVERSVVSYDFLATKDGRNSNVPSPMRPLDFYSILQEAIKTAEHNSSQLRALVYDRARFNLKRDILYGHSSMGLAELVQQIKDFELAVARIEANAVDDQPNPPAQTESPDTARDHVEQRS